MTTVAHRAARPRH